MNRPHALLAMGTALLLFLGGCSDHTAQETPATRTLFAMDTYMTLTAYGDNGERAVRQAASYIETLDATLSIGVADSEISRLNAAGSGTLSEDAAAILSRALEIAAETDGAFNPLLYPLMDAWGFYSQDYRVPDLDELATLLPLADITQLDFNAQSGSVTFRQPGMQLDLGGIAKGYTSAQLMEIYRDCGVTSGMVSLGGNIQVLGTKPDGSDWRVALRDPDSTDTYLGVLTVTDVAVVTSGGYERYFEQDGKRYHHILDPATGMPANQGLVSVTIVSDDGTLADGLSTALFVMGLEQATDFWRAHADQFDAVFLTDSDTLYVTAGIAQALSETKYPVTYLTP